MQIKGKINRIFFTRDGWSSFSVKEENGCVHKCAGTTFGELKLGMLVEITGTQEMTNYGIQLTIETFRVPLPSGKAGLLEFLASGLIKGVGNVMAGKIIDAFGEDAIKIIMGEPERLLLVPGISDKKAASIISGVGQFASYEEIFEITGGEITKLQAGKIIKEFGAGAVKVLRENPYLLYERIDGFGFLLTDRIAKSSGVDRFSFSRMKAVIDYVLVQIGEVAGHCYVTVPEMQRDALELLSPMPKALSERRGFRNGVQKLMDAWPESRDEIVREYRLTTAETELLSGWADQRNGYIDALAQALVISQEEGRIVIDGEHIASAKLYKAEQLVAARIKERLSSGPTGICPEEVAEKLGEYENRVGFELAPAQKEAATKAVTNHISMITGGPGTGKTSSIESIIYTYKELTGGDVILMAPTGRAAARIKEKLTDKDVLSATIHKMTGGGRMPAMVHPTSRTLIIVDESSMININLASVLMDYAADAECLVLVGDQNQLPAIGAGNFFRDMLISGKVPKTTLTIGFRNAGLIAKNAQAVNSGKTHLEGGPDFTINMMEREKISDKIVSDYIEAVRSGQKAKDMCLLSLQRTRGPVCVDLLNHRIQDAINPVTKSNSLLQGTDLRIGDRIMQIHNNYSQEYTLPDGSSGKGVFNGDTGTVADMDSDNDTIVIEWDDGRVSEYERINFSDLTLAYAVTVHKSQGSEYRTIFMAITMDAYTLLSRSICYTGLTRASEKVNLYAEPKALSMAIRQETNSKRSTRLVSLLAV